MTGDTGANDFTINRAVALRRTQGLGPDPALWTDAEETALLQTYVVLREPTSMTDSADRANKILALTNSVTTSAASLLSTTRGSFQP